MTDSKSSSFLFLIITLKIFSHFIIFLQFIVLFLFVLIQKETAAADRKKIKKSQTRYAQIVGFRKELTVYFINHLSLDIYHL